MAQRFRVAVVGVGYMGTLHALKYDALDNVDLVAVVDERVSRVERVAKRLGCQPFTCVDQLLDSELRTDAVSIATPTDSHFEIAMKFLTAGIHCLVEKPLAAMSDQAAKMVAIAQQGGLILLAGHIERFNPAVRQVRLRKPCVEYIKAYRVGPMSFRSVDIDVVADVMLHDIDLALFLTRLRPSKVEIVRAVGSPAGINDIVNAHLVFGERCFVDLTASRLAIARRRKMRMFTRDGYYSIDCSRRSAVAVSREDYYAGTSKLKEYQEMGNNPGSTEIFEAVGARQLVKMGSEAESDPLSSELRYFLDKVAGECVDPEYLRAQDGVVAIEIVEKILSTLAESAKSCMVPAESLRG